MRSIVAFVLLTAAAGGHAQNAQLPDAPEPRTGLQDSGDSAMGGVSSSLDEAWNASPVAYFGAYADQGQDRKPDQKQASGRQVDDSPVDSNGKPIPLEKQQPKRILGFMPNFRTVSGGAKPPPPGWKNNFKVATHQATDYSSFIFLGLTSLFAEGTDAHPALGKGIGGYYAYTWRGFIDKSDNTYLSAWLLPSLLHEDTRYYALGSGHRVATRILYVISRQAVARTYSGHDTANIAGLGGKALTQVVSRAYYPSSTTSFSSLATRFGYSVMRDVMFSALREFYPDIAAHYIKKHREKATREARR